MRGGECVRAGVRERMREKERERERERERGVESVRGGGSVFVRECEGECVKGEKANVRKGARAVCMCVCVGVSVRERERNIEKLCVRWRECVCE